MEAKVKKTVQKTEAPVICFVESGSVSVVGYHRVLVKCANMEEGVIAVLSIYYVCSIEYDVKQRMFLQFLQFMLTGESCIKFGKKANQLIKLLKLE